MNLTSLHQIPLGTVYEDEPSDSLSSNEQLSEGGFSPRSNKENNPFYLQHFSTDCDSEAALDNQTKKIRKKRTAYAKIDDEIRLQLFEAVQQNGETLKSAAKRLNINYSSAKSILHTYRKEGRILKKNALERTLKITSLSPSEIEMNQFTTFPPLMLNEHIYNKTAQVPVHQGYQFTEFYQQETTTTADTTTYENTPCSPMHGLADNIGQISLDNQFIKQEQTPSTHSTQHIQFSMPEPELPTLRKLINKPKLPISDMLAQGPIQGSSPSPVIPALNLPSNHQPGNPLEKLKHLDNFYMNYSNSPLSGNNKMFQERADTGSRSKGQNEFDSFSEMVNCLQTTNENKSDKPMSRSLRLNTAQMVQDRADMPFVKDESPNWGNNLEHAAFDTYKSFMDAQWLLQGAMKKANHLNHLVNMQQSSGISPNGVPTGNWKF